MGLTKEMDLPTKVFDASKNGYLQQLKRFLENKPPQVAKSVVATKTQGSTPLIMACKNGHLPVVEYIVEKCNADVEQVGTVSFDGENIEGAPPLWCAAAAGHFEIVKYLVRKKAKVNNTTDSNSTPLRAACFDGHFEIVRYLIDHKADIEIANRHGHTCLMIACYKGHTKIVKYLIDKGADINRKSLKGNTALHDCAESGCLGIMKLLLSYQARMEQDAYGMTPLLAAAVTGHAKIVEYICSRHDCNTVQMIDALELLGATYVDKKRDMLGAVDLWKRAMAQRLNYQVWKRGGGQPKAAYCYAVEARTMDEVEDLLTDQDDMRMQALLIRERVLGPTHPDTSYYIRYRGAVYADTGEFERCTVLWMYALDMQQRSFDPLSQMTQSSFLSFAELFSFMLGDKLEDELPQDVDYSQILVVFEKALTEARRGKIAMQEAKDSKLSFNRLVLILMHFLKLLCDIEEHMSKDDRYKFRKMTYQLVKMELQGEKGFRLLHFACAAATSNVGKHPVCQYPSLQVVKLLLHVGETVDCRDADGNTPLHIASMEQPCDPQIIDLLIDSGAHIDTVNAQGQRPLDLFPPETVCGLQSPVNAMSLQCLAAAVIRKHHIPYDMVLSKKLVEFVDAH